jgi:simple sugar transport system permease protein
MAAIFGATFLAYLTVGGNYMQIFGFQREIVSVITSIIIYFSAFSLFMRHGIERALLRGKKKDADETGEESV